MVDQRFAMDADCSGVDYRHRLYCHLYHATSRDLTATPRTVVTNAAVEFCIDWNREAARRRLSTLDRLRAGADPADLFRESHESHRHDRDLGGTTHSFTKHY